MAWTHLVAAASSVAAGAFFVAMGLRLRRRAGDTGPVVAVRALALWWLGIGAATWSYAAFLLVGAADLLPAARVARAVGVGFTAVAVWGLTAFLFYLYQGDRRWFRSMAVVYGVLVVGTWGRRGRHAPLRVRERCGRGVDGGVPGPAGGGRCPPAAPPAAC